MIEYVGGSFTYANVQEKGNSHEETGDVRFRVNTIGQFGNGGDQCS